MSLYDMPIPIYRIEDQPNIENVSREWELFCLKNRRIPGSPARYRDETDFSSLTDNYQFRNVRLKGIEELDIVELKIEENLIKKYNISPETLWCGHRECFESSKKIPITTREKKQETVYFCSKEKGLFPKFLDTLESDLKQYGAQLLRYPSTTTYAFIEQLAKAERNLLIKTFDDFLKEAPEVRITELGVAFTKDIETTKEKFPNYIGRTLAKGVRVLDISTKNSKAYVLKHRGLRVVGTRMFSDVYPDILNDALKEGLSDILDGKNYENCLENAKQRIKGASPDEFLSEVVLRHDWRTVNARTDVSKLKVDLARRYTELVRQKIIETKDDEKSFGVKVKGAITIEGPRLDFEDYSKIDREYYFKLISSTFARFSTFAKQKNKKSSIHQRSLEAYY